MDVFVSSGSPKRTLVFNFNYSVRITKQKKPCLLPCLVHVPVCMHKISILICGVVVVDINTQFTNTSACCHPQTRGFFFSTHQMV